jgi:hypothetical protein
MFADNRIIEVLRDSGDTYTIARYTATGIPDGSFTAIILVSHLLTLPDRKLVVVGTSGLVSI